GDETTLMHLLPTMIDIVEHHVAGTKFGIGMDPSDGLLRQGAEGYQLTWMDAKVDGWVVTPRRGKAVEINALWYNALISTALPRRGVTTHPSTFASIHVSWYPSAPWRSRPSDGSMPIPNFVPAT